MKNLGFFASVACVLLLCACAPSDSMTVQAPNKAISVKINAPTDAFGAVTMDVMCGDSVALAGVRLGVKTLNDDFCSAMKFVQASNAETVRDDYQMLAGKRKHCVNEANARTFSFATEKGGELKVELRAYNDGVALRYHLNTAAPDSVVADCTAFTIANGTKRWMQSYDPSSYERFYPEATNGENVEKHQDGDWAFPALIEARDSLFLLVTEANIERNHSAAYITNKTNKELFELHLGSAMPADGEWVSPWRLFITGSLATIVESTLVTDVSNPCVTTDTEWIKPAPAAWVYWSSNHGSNDYAIVKTFSDLAKTMQWPYVLIDAEWDVMKNGGNVEDAVRYARDLGVKPMVWYNSSVSWTGDDAPTPLYRLNKSEDREKEFKWLNDNGICGVKIDFFYGDGMNMMNYYLDLLEDALKHKLLVTFHGATLPRGWQRTYPNLMTMEGVYGAEWYNNKPILTDRAACHNATLPFTRNVVGPMDYTPGTFTDSQHPHITSHGHELALVYLFESAIQHMPDRPEGYASLPDDVRNMLSYLPTTWDDTRLIDGYPGKYVVMARRSGDTWYVAGINGTDNPLTIKADLTKLGVEGKQITLFADGASQLEFAPTATMQASNSPLEIPCLPRGGFVAEIK